MSSGRPAPPGGLLTAQGHPRSVFRRAIEHGNFVIAEITAHDVGRLTLDESLALTALAVEKASGRRSRYAVRWLRRLLEEDPNVSIEEAALAASALAALGSRTHAEALATLQAMAERATRRDKLEAERTSLAATAFAWSGSTAHAEAPDRIASGGRPD